MKILFLSISMPDLRVSSNMYAALVKEFARRGHEVCVVAPVSDGTGTRFSAPAENIRLLQVKSLPLFGVNLVRKGIANVLLPFVYQRAIDAHLRGEKFDLIIAPTPPITLADVVAKMKKRCGAKTYLILRDIFPQNAVDLGFMKKWWPLYWRFRLQEKKLYRVCDKIGCMSQGNVDYIRKHNPDVPAEKLHILENFQALETEPAPADEDLKEKYGVGGKFVVPFSAVASASNSLQLQLLDGSGNILRYWNVNLAAVQENVIDITAVEPAAANEVSTSSYSVLRNHLYTLGMRKAGDNGGDDDPDGDEDNPEDLNKGQQLVIKVSGAWENITGMVLD